MQKILEKRSKRLFLWLILAAVSFVIFSCGGSLFKTESGVNPVKNPKVAQVQSDLSGITITMTYDSNFAHDVYVVETGSAIQDSGKYSDKVLIQFPCTGQTVSKYVIIPSRLTAIIKTKYDMSSYDRTDFAFTHDSLYVVNTSQTNAGLYTTSSIYVLPTLDSKYEYETYFSGRANICNMNKKLFMQVLDFCSKNDIKY
jgi:hypothetical protein